MKKNAFILLIFIFLSEILFSCFFCSSEGHHLNLTGISTDVFHVKDTVLCYTKNDTTICNDSQKIISQTDSSISKQDSFLISIDFLTSQITQYHFNSILSSTAYACQESDYLGFQTDVKAIELKCNQNILGTKTGDLIDNSKLIFNESYSSTGLYAKDLSVHEFIDELNNPGPGHYGPVDYFIRFNEPIKSSNYIIFDISIILENDEKYTTTTIPVKIIE